MRNRMIKYLENKEKCTKLCFCKNLCKTIQYQCNLYRIRSPLSGDKKLIGPSKTDALLTLIQQFLQDIPQHHFYAVGQIEITT